MLAAMAGVSISCFGANGDDDDDDDDDAANAGDDDGYDDDDFAGDDDGGWDDDGDWSDDDMGGDDDDWWDDDIDDDDTVEDPQIVCPDETQDTVLFLSADDSNSQASPVVARRLILDGYIVPRRYLRTYEFTNYYQIDYPFPAEGRINVVPQLRLLDDGSDDGFSTYTFQIGAQSHSLAHASGRHLNVTFSLDTSGSMTGAPIARLRYVARAIAARLKAGDIVSLVEWDQSTSVVLEAHVVDGPNDATLLAAIDGLEEGGSTDLHGGLVRAYQLAADHFDETRMNRVVLISDGWANTGVTDVELIAEAADDSEGEGIYLLGVGVGDADYYNEQLMDDVTDAGKGAYIFIDTQAEADKQFGDRFQENMEIAAMAVRVRLQMPYYPVMEEFHGEEYSENPQEVEPQHLGPNDAMVFHQFLAVCDGDLFQDGDVINVRAEYTHPVTRAAQTDEAEFSIAQLLAADADQLVKGDAIVSYAEALKEIDRLGDEGDWDGASTACADAHTKVQAAATQLGDTELEEIADLLETYQDTIEYRR
ncbi:MAG: VWA domain-containing protein [Deltaproteobacteria bacterium]|nr:VWA domain-containing protein [Deltaproteobacteria bacterium]